MSADAEQVARELVKNADLYDLFKLTLQNKEAQQYIIDKSMQIKAKNHNNDQ